MNVSRISEFLDRNKYSAQAEEWICHVHVWWMHDGCWNWSFDYTLSSQQHLLEMWFDVHVKRIGFLRFLC